MKIPIKHFSFVAILAGCVLTGCKSPMQRVLAQNPQWEKVARRTAEDLNADKCELRREPFSDARNPLHKEIWMAFWKRGDVGDGMGAVCSYYGHYLVTLSDNRGHGRVSYFYDPKDRHVLEADEDTAFHAYGGDKNASLEDARRLVVNLAAVIGYEAIPVEDPDDIPHKAFQRENPNIAFKAYLLSKGITIRPPKLLQKNEEADFSAYSECNFIVYVPLGGRIFRYDLRCERGRIVAVSRFLLCSDVGDCWYIM